mgnify:CR=1 FL=1
MKSMTGFGAAGRENEDYKVHVEVKSVNQRYLDISFSMPRALNVFENDMRHAIKKFSARGKIDVNIAFHDKREKEATIVVDKNLARAYQTALYELGDFLHLTPPADVCKIALYPDVLRVHEESRDVLDARELVFDALESALEHFAQMRKKEGEHTRLDFEPRLDFLAEARGGGWLPVGTCQHRYVLPLRSVELELIDQPAELRQEDVLDSFADHQREGRIVDIL